MSDYETVKNYYKDILPYLDHGFVALVDFMGDDKAIVEAARISYGKDNHVRTEKEDKNLIRYLYRNRHTSPFEMCEFKFFIKMPIFVMRQHVRHRTAAINEYSGRYSVMTAEAYRPNMDMMKTQSKSNKQMGHESLPIEITDQITDILTDSYTKTFDGYKNCLSLGLARETARIQLPLATYTELYWKMDLKNLFNYLKLRNDPKHAQPEIVLLAQAIGTLVKKYVPIAYEAFEDYDCNSITFSKDELICLSKYIKQEIIDKPSSFSENEWQSFIEKINFIVNN